MVNIGDRLSPDFTDPLGLLSDCHRRIERFLSVLMAVTEQGRGAALDSTQRDALVSALRYFREAAPKHTSDEETSLFPRLRALSDPRVQAAFDTIQMLEADHQVANLDHAEVERLCERWLAEGRLAAGAVRELAGRLHELRALYQHHIAIEDTRIFPLARELLAADAIAQIGDEMAHRRGIPTAGVAAHASGADREH